MSAGLFDINGFSWSIIGVQALGVLTAFAWSFGLGFALFTIIKKTIGLRVIEAEEMDGLDVGEHGLEAYPEFERVA